MSSSPEKPKAVAPTHSATEENAKVEAKDLLAYTPSPMTSHISPLMTHFHGRPKELIVPEDCRYRRHPWHGLSAGEKAPMEVTAYIELVPSDTVKFELDKESGFLKVDRPQKYSNVSPTMYGFIPRTYCGKRIAAHAGVERGDGDPLDVCVLSDRPISHGDFIVRVIPIGGLCLIDKGEADDKIIAYVAQDDFYREWRTLSDAPHSVIERLQHYFLTYKMPPGWKTTSELRWTYERDEALNVIRMAMEDYNDYMEDRNAKVKALALEQALESSPAPAASPAANGIIPAPAASPAASGAIPAAASPKLA